MYEQPSNFRCCIDDQKHIDQLNLRPSKRRQTWKMHHQLCTANKQSTDQCDSTPKDSFHEVHKLLIHFLSEEGRWGRLLYFKLRKKHQVLSGSINQMFKLARRHFRPLTIPEHQWHLGSVWLNCFSSLTRNQRRFGFFIASMSEARTLKPPTCVCRLLARCSGSCSDNLTWEFLHLGCRTTHHLADYLLKPSEVKLSGAGSLSTVRLCILEEAGQRLRRF